MGTRDYVHGYSSRESGRLSAQADTLANILHDDTRFPAGSRVLEVGCGVGAQTLHILARNPGIQLTAIDVSEPSLSRARRTVSNSFPDANVTFYVLDLFELPFSVQSFDHVIICFVLEHLSRPEQALAELRRLLAPDGTLTVIEGDHGTVVMHPDSPYARATIDCQIRLQAQAGGNALIGRQLQPLLKAAGYSDVATRACTMYVDETYPALTTGFTRDTFTAMIESVREDALAAGLIDAEDWDHGIADLHRTARSGGTFHYTFFKARARPSVRLLDVPAASTLQ